MKEIIDGVVDEIWKGFFGLEVSPNTDDQHAIASDAVIGYVTITGDHNLTVVVFCEVTALREAASKFFYMEPADVDDDTMLDSMRELVNLVGGNIKNLLGGGPHKLTTPVLCTRDELNAQGGKQIVHEQGFFSGGGGVAIEVYKND